jgi:hypothetical protein
MKFFTHGLLIAAALAAPAAAGDLSASDAAALSARSDPSLAAQRAAGLSAPVFGDEDRAGVSAAEAAAPEVANLRDEDIHLSDHDLTVIAVTALIVIVIVIIV